MLNTFYDDLERGLIIERKALTLIRKKFPSASLIHKFKGYDIWIPESNCSIEVKYDPMSNKTGNLVVEFEFNNKQSALITTTATYWMFYDDNQWILIKPKDIFYCIFINRLQWSTFKADGDSKYKKAYLIKKEMLMNFAYKIQTEALC
jgi:hypothetical protein